MSLHYGKNFLNQMRYGLKVQRATISGDFQVHTHAFSEIVVILSGSATHLVGSASHALQPGDVYVIKGSLPHGFLDARQLDLINLMYDALLFNYKENELRAIPGFEPLLIVEPELWMAPDCREVLRLSAADLHRVTTLTELILDLAEPPQPANEPVVKTLFLALISFIASRYDCPGEAAAPMRLLNEAARFMQENLARSLKVEDIAAHLSLSVRHLNRLFQRQLEQTPMGYLSDLRLRYALTLLSKGTLPVGTVARLCGFRDAAYFSRAFREKFGISPSRCRLIE